MNEEILIKTKTENVNELIKNIELQMDERAERRIELESFLKSNEKFVEQNHRIMTHELVNIPGLNSYMSRQEKVKEQRSKEFIMSTTSHSSTSRGEIHSNFDDPIPIFKIAN